MQEGVFFVLKSIRRRIATILALFGIINPKTKAASKAQVAGYCAVSFGFYQFEESISEKNTVSVVQCCFSKDGETVTKKVTYKFILDNDKQVRIQKFIFEANKGERMDRESVIIGHGKNSL